MKALIKKYAKEGIWMDEVPIPSPGTNEVLIKISKTAICGTDLHIYHWDNWAQRNIQTPRIIGHEFVGEIVEIGAGVHGYSAGDRVTGEGHITCGVCRNCRAGKRHLCNKTIGIGGGRDGAFAEYLVMPAFNLWPVHDDVSSDIAAIHDPLGNAVHTALSFDLVGEDVLVTGAGPIGIMAAAVSCFVGARHVVISDICDYRLELAKKIANVETVNVTRDSISDVIEKVKMHDGFDVGLEMSGNPQAFNDMIHNMYNGGHIALLGFLPPETEINWDEVLFKGLLIKGVYGREMFETWYKMSQLIHSGLDLTSIITHRFPVDNFQNAFDVMHEAKCGKVLLEWD